MQRKWLAAGVAALAGALLVAVGGAAVAIGGTTTTTQTYVVLYKQQSVGSDAAATIEKAGGSLVYSYPQIGVVIARSDSATFRDSLLKNSAVENAAATTDFGVKVGNDFGPPGADGASGPPPGDLPNAPATAA